MYQNFLSLATEAAREGGQGEVCSDKQLSLLRARKWACRRHGLWEPLRSCLGRSCSTEEGQLWGKKAGGAASVGTVWDSVWRVGPAVQSHVGAVLGELQPMESPGDQFRKNETVGTGLRVTMEGQQRWSIMDSPQPPFPIILSCVTGKGRRGWMSARYFLFVFSNRH